MTVRDPNDGKYVATTPNASSKGDQNMAVVGPARVQDEEETQQQIDKGIAQASFTSSVLQGKVKLGQLAPDYWHTSHYLTGRASFRMYTDWSAIFYPIRINETSTIDALGLYKISGASAQQHPWFDMTLGIYNEVDGLPYLLLLQTGQFNIADASIPANSFHIEEFGAKLELRPGRYWLAWRRRTPTGILNSTPLVRAAYISKNNLSMGYKAFPFSTPTTPRSVGIAVEYPTVATGSPVNLPAIFDINAYTYGGIIDATPEIYVRAVQNA